ncbi:patatin-like phospholipase family protein [Massilia sp. W12]|uniref:patatin-like phospholipase family protein n=1 Tax=Massilia sp. W12 TaxID=3126507 RepID=UPI0030D43364
MATSLKKKPGGKRALLIGGGAPNSSLIAGALVAFLEKKVHFDVISTSGAGTLMGLLYKAPRNGDAKKSLQAWAKAGVSDAIYRWFPIDYKVFQKPGLGAELYRNMLLANPFTRPYVDMFAPNAQFGLWPDIVNFWLSTFSPMYLTPFSLGMCAHLPFINEAVDFAQVKKMKEQFYISSYNLDKEAMEIWDKGQITADHVKAAFAFPFIYPPYHMNGNDYIEGAAVDSLNFEALVSDDEKTPGIERDIESIVIFEILGNKKLIQKPDYLYDAWVNSIITPLVQNTKDDIKLFELVHNRDPVTGKPKRKLLKVPLMKDIPEQHWKHVLDWSNSNVELLYKLGYEAGLEFCEKHKAELGLNLKPSPEMEEA